MKLLPSSIRAKLTLTAVAVMGVLFVLLGVVVEVAGREQIMNGIDSELARRADQIITAHKLTEKEMQPRDGQPPIPFAPRQNHMGQRRNGPDDRGPDDHPDDGGHRDEGQPQGQPQGQGPQPGGPRGDGGGPRRFGALLRRLHEIGDQTLAVGPRFITTNDSPPFAPPDMRDPYDKQAVAMAKVNPVYYSTVTIGQGASAQPMRLITRAAKDENGREWVVQVPYPLGQVDLALKTLNTTLLILLPIGLLLTAIACLFLMSRIMRPIREINSTTASISAEDLSGRLKVKGRDEFAELGATINAMLSRLEEAFKVQQQIIRQQRRFTADASHELKTPLAVIKANTGLMLHGDGLTPDVREQIQAVDSAATRMNRLVQGLMALAKADSGTALSESKPFDLNLAVQNAADQVHRGPHQSIEYSDEDQTVTVYGVERDIERVFVNLIDNACRYMGDAGQVRVTVRRDGDKAVAVVSDEGPGIAAEHLPHIFDRFYRADAARSAATGGTGLGLAICKSIVEATRGTISIESTVGKGTSVTVVLPIFAKSDLV